MSPLPLLTSAPGVWVPLHGVGTRQDLPLPFSLVVVGAVAVLVVTFVVALRLWSRPRWQTAAGLPLPRLTRLVDHPAVVWTGRLVVLAVAGVGQVALWFGADLDRNPFPGLLFVWVWVGLVPVSLLLGAVWRRFSVVRLLMAWRGTLRADEPLPQWGLWPAALALVAFGYLELVQPDRTHLSVLRWWFLIWLVWVVGGALAFGGRWIASADPFEAYATLVSRVSPWQRIDGVLHVVNPLRHLASSRPHRGTWAVGAALIGVTLFDSLGSSTAWVQTVQSSDRPPQLWSGLGLLVLVAIAVGLYLLGATALETTTRTGEGASVNRLGVSLVPIAVGYTFAHYASYLVLEGQRVAVNLSDPLSRGQDWFGTATLGVDAGLVDHPTLMAWNQVMGIVLGHVMAVLVAHDLAVRWLPTAGTARGQLPLLVVMVAYTCGGLLLLFAG
ncbi:hypothetical protein [Aestuariimicrobium sp. T2.26MG-19.2B]|uniref:hypothetical protein n=1 Tax=Aestuariimicrobium sp. T2.26MG-19.2B TaxID=3040679 RepID=UPI00254087F2|nr:hypothetical protein [Aestuariimicrobium sp. T2.26MG-19.2B]